AELVDKYGVDIAALDTSRREWGKKSVKILLYKAELLKRVEFYLNDRLALVTIPLSEIEAYSEQYNPAMLVLEELRNTENVDIAVAVKDYGNRITGKLRCNYTAVCDKIAEHFGGGGHPFAAGFKTRDWRIDELKKELIKVVKDKLS
ncbi:MAG TPA: DHHA1 domain-containing protein, partial [Aquirhabdus sp.]